MAKVNANYEVVYILDPAMGEEAIAAMIEKFKTLVETQGTVSEVDEWGKLLDHLRFGVTYHIEFGSFLIDRSDVSKEKDLSCIE